MAALALWCSVHLEPNFIHVAYKELCEACDVLSGSKRQTGVLVRFAPDLHHKRLLLIAS